MEELRRELCIRGHHIYKNIWNPVVGEVLVCEGESHNAADWYFAAIAKGGVVVGHLPRKLAKLCLLFLAKRWYNTLHSDWNVVVNFRCRKIFVLLIFRYQQAIRKYMNTENFPIYGTVLLDTKQPVIGI